MVLPTSIDLRHPEKYILTLRISPDDVLLMISEDGTIKKCHTCKSFKFDKTIDLYANIKKLFFELAFLTLPFSSINIVWVTSRYTIVPNEILDFIPKNDLYNISQLQSPESIINQQSLSFDNLTLTYEIDKNIHGFLIRNIFQPKIYTHVDLLLTFLRKKSDIQKETFLFVCVYQNFVDIFLFKEGNFQIAQSFNDIDSDELFYFILKFWESSFFNQEEDALYHNGLNLNTVHQLKDYIANVEFFNVPSETNIWSQSTDVVPLDLISLSL